MHTILVADDSVTILKAVEIAFDKEPFQVVKAGSGTEAIARARELKPHLVLVDHLMGDKNGYEVAESLHADPATSGIPVMMLSGTNAPYDEGRARAAGVVGHVPKPFDCATLLDRVRNLLGVAATAPGTAVIVPTTSGAPTSAAVAGMPRPPGVPGTAAGMPRPPGAPGIGLPRPPVTGAPAVAVSPSVPLAATPPVAPTTAPVTRSPTPQPTRAEIDPFGFGAALGAATPARPATPVSATPAAVSTPPVAAATPAFANPFATASTIGTPAPMTTPVMSTPPSIAATPAVPKAAPTYAVESEFLEVGDIEVSDIPATPSLPPQPATAATPLPAPAAEAARSTNKVDIERLAKLDAEAERLASMTAAATSTVVARAQGALAPAPSKEVLSEEARQIVERIAWEVVPELAEVIIREEIQRLLKQRA